MATRLLPKTISSSLSLNPKFILTLGSIHSRKLHTNEVPVKEVKVPIVGGHIAGKLWGHGDERPILALHGWQDNAGTWDSLAPKLLKVNKRPILAIDFPGHGFSSWIPPGVQYHFWDHPRLILQLKEHFKWDKVSLLTHSMGATAGFRFASLFPDDVDFYVAVDNLTNDYYDLDAVVDRYRIMLQKQIVTQRRTNEEPPAYTMEEITKIWYLGTNKSVALENLHHLLKRGTRPSKLDPNKFCFSRDARLKYSLFNMENPKFLEKLALRLKCPILYFKATDSPYAADGLAVQMRENNEKFESHFLPGTHHIHLNNPDILLPHIVNFLQKHNVLIK